MVHFTWRVTCFGLIGFLIGATWQAFQLFQKYGDRFNPVDGLGRMVGSGVALLLVGALIGFMTRR